MTPFEPAPLIGNQHLQTMWQSAFRRFIDVPTRSEVWTTPDGEVLDIDFLPHVENAPGVLVIHGLEASSKAPYVRGMLRALYERGLNAAAMNLRGCGPSFQKLPLTYHSGFTQDVQLVVEQLLDRWGALGIVGFSLGANLTLKWLGERGSDAPSVASVAISPPFDLAAVADLVDADAFWPRAYRGHFIRPLKRKAMRLARDHAEAPLDLEQIRRAKDFRTFDAAVTVPLHGFDDVAHYWRVASCKYYLAGIEKPVLVISAEDDPLIPGHIIPDAEIEKNPHIELWRTSAGGHVGFVSGSIFKPEFVAERRAVDYLADFLT